MRRKLIEQVIGKSCFYSEAMSAGNTSAHASLGVDREGYLSAYIAALHQGATAAGTTQSVTLHMYDSSDNSTFAIKNSATDTLAITVTSATGSASGLNVDLSGYKRYFAVYLTHTAALTNTVTFSVAAVLGDAIDEPAV